MSWRVVAVTGTAKLDYKMGYLVMRKADETRRVHISEISVLLIESTAVSLTAYLLCELAKRKICIIFCDEKRMPFGLFSAIYGNYETSLKFRSQLRWNSDIKSFVWAEIVRAKISGQVAVLKAFEKPESALLESYLFQIEPADSTNREGHAAKVYFNSLFGMEFSRSQENNINSALNYGYSIVLSAIAREIVSAGYATQLGIFHDNMFNQFNLACDFMEPFRPFVDYTVSKMDLTFFAHDEKMHLVNILNRIVMLEGRQEYMLNAIKLYVRSVFNALNENDMSLINFPGYELQIYENDCIL